MATARRATEEKAVLVERPPAAGYSFLRIGQLVHLVSSGRTFQYREILDMDQHFLKIRSDVSVAPQTEIVLIPWSQIEAIGITDER